jgi:hypothetical protein
MADLPRLRGMLEQAFDPATADLGALEAALHRELPALQAAASMSGTSEEAYGRQVVLACAIAWLRQHVSSSGTGWAGPEGALESTLLAAECLRLVRDRDRIEQQRDAAIRTLLRLDDRVVAEREAQASQDWRDVADLLARFRRSTRFRIGDRIARAVEKLLARPTLHCRTTLDAAEEIVQRHAVVGDPSNE